MWSGGSSALVSEGRFLGAGVRGYGVGDRSGFGGRAEVVRCGDLPLSVRLVRLRVEVGRDAGGVRVGGARGGQRLNAARAPRPTSSEPAPTPEELRQRLSDALHAGTLSADSYAHQLRLLDARTPRA